MHRELFNLLVNSGNQQYTIHTLAPSATKKGYTNAKIQFGRRQLKHWERVGENPDKVYPFARFNKQTPFLMFTDGEYEDYLQDTRWSKAETQHLLDLCRQFDNRWVVVNDRFDREKFKSKKAWKT
uniref:Myb-like domain-containing protein n=1 Tax=Ditylenchus dipsaci TaxID=166011 RepID=A0A915EUQ5_9BILA